MINESAVGLNGLDIKNLRKDFPVLNREVHAKPLVYLDNAASSQMPRQVIESYTDYFSNYHSNVHRGVHTLSQEATDLFENSRLSMQKFLNAGDSKEIIFTSGTTDGMNLVAQSFGRTNVKEGDEVLISAMEHHSNIVPWRMLCDEKKAILKVIPMNDKGELDLEAYSNLLTSKTKIVGIMHVSNALGTINPIKQMITEAHAKGIPVLVDGAQAVPHITVDVQDLDCDFYALSGHKMFGPTGVGVLYGKKELLEEMPPYRGGGDMILNVTFDEIIYNNIPYKFEAGTPGIAQVIGIGRAAEYLMDKGREELYAYENDLLEYATDKLSQIKGLRIIGTAKNKASVISFVLEGIHPHDIGTLLDQEGIAVRTGHHCAQPVMERFKIPATTRASFAFYNTKEEVDILVNGIKSVIEIFN
ncbi:MAG: cysteine desulfurase [Balneolales bacterium]